MKNFKNFKAEKYSLPDFQEVEDGIYRAKNPYYSKGDELGDEEIYVTSLTFEMEPDSYGEEDGSPQNITQCPFENILDEFMVYVTDFYYELNDKSETLCYQEFGSSHIEDIRNLRSIIGKRAYAVPFIDDDDGEEYYDFKIE